MFFSVTRNLLLPDLAGKALYAILAGYAFKKMTYQLCQGKKKLMSLEEPVVRQTMRSYVHAVNTQDPRAFGDISTI